MSDTQDFTFLPTEKGRPMLCYQNYLYLCNKKHKNRSFWTCRLNKMNGCKRRICLENDSKILFARHAHCHEPDFKRIERIHFCTRITEEIKNNSLLPIPQIYKQQLEKLPESKKKLVPTYDNIRTRLYNARQLIHPTLYPRPLEQLPVVLDGFDITKKGLLQRLSEGVVIGDGGFVFSLEKRGYVKAGPWTPEAAVEHPEAVKSLHREFLRAGSDVMQAFTFYASDDKLINRGNKAGVRFTGADINDAACKLAREVANEGDALVAGGISQTPSYLSMKGKKLVQEEFRKQVDVFIKNKVDFLICEYFEHIEEMEWAIEVCKETQLPIAATMCIGTEGDMHGVDVGTCAIRMAVAGAHVVGLNCHYDPFMMLDALSIMKDSLKAAGLEPHLMSQPLGYHTPDAGKQGFIDLPEFPFALEPRVCTRWDMQRYARRAYQLGIRYIGGCCGIESYHIRAVSEELALERAKTPLSSEKHEPWGEGLKMHTKPWVRARARKSYWENLNPATGRLYSAAFSKPDNWGVTAGSEDLKQKVESTTQEELQKVFAKSEK